MRLLVLGGTGFVGRAFVAAALEAGHDVTLFNRGTTDPGAFPDVERVIGDRGVDLAPLDGRTWDAAFDASCYVPRVARMSAGALDGRVGHYTFVSSLSVYADERTPNQDESSPVATTDDPTSEVVDDRTYGPLKALCEQEVQAVFAERAVIVRAGFIVGPFDNVDRLPWWIRRIARGGRVAAPVGPDYPVQLIDARDIASWALSMAERGRGGVFNVCGADRPYRLGEVLDTVRRVTSADAELEWLPEEFLLAQGLVPDDEPFPYWLGPDGLAISAFDNRRALDAGLAFRPLEDTVGETHAWDRGRSGDGAMRCGIAPERERALLMAWDASRRSALETS
jgi:nucleoside-diphosphate-sugar epimerase